MIPRWKNNRQLRGRANCYSIARDKIVPLEYEQLSLTIISDIANNVSHNASHVKYFFFTIKANIYCRYVIAINIFY